LLQREPEMRTVIQSVISEAGYQGVSREALLQALERTGSLQMTFQRAIEYANAAMSSLEVLDNSIYTQALSSIPGYIVERDR